MRLKASLEERRRKERLADKLLANLPLGEIAEWLWDDYGIKVSRLDEGRIRRALLKHDVIRDRDIAAYLLSEGIDVSEEDWYGGSPPRR